MEKVYLYNSNIDAINVVKEGKGKIFISLKENVTLKNLNQLDYKNINLIDNKVFIIDSKIIKKPSEIKIDSKEIGGLEIVKSSKLESQPCIFSLIKITTHTELEKIKKQKKGEVIIR